MEIAMATGYMDASEAAAKALLFLMDVYGAGDVLGAFFDYMDFDRQVEFVNDFIKYNDVDKLVEFMNDFIKSTT